MARSRRIIILLSFLLSSNLLADNSSYLWQQIAGTPIVLNDPTKPATTFIAPNISGSLLLSLNVNNSVNQLSITVIPTDDPIIIPWLEANSPRLKVEDVYPGAERSDPDMTLREYAFEGMLIWDNISDTMIVSTRIGQIYNLYGPLMSWKPADVNLIGGIKTYVLEGTRPDDDRPFNFADPVGWETIAAASEEVARLTGQNIVLLENETALDKFHNGSAGIDTAALAVSLVPLRDTGIVYWWNLPRIKPDSVEFPTQHEETMELVKTIADALPTCVFLTTYTAWYNQSDETKQTRLEMIEMVGLERMQERLFATPDGYVHYPSRDRRCFTSVEAMEQINTLPGAEINVFPTGPYWITIGRELAELANER